MTYPAIQFYINGVWLDSHDQREPVINPATGEPLGEVPFANAALLEEAVAAAAAGFKHWRSVSAHERSKIMRAACDLLRKRTAHVAEMLTLEQGKPIAEATIEVTMAADIIEWYAEEGKRAYGRIIPSRLPGVRQLVTHEPVGPVAAFSPWNFPAVAPIRKIAGAIAAGCSIIIKPSEETPATCLELVRAFADAGLPPGVLNLVYGNAALVSEFMMRSEVIRKISFTGSVPVGKLLLKQAADTLKRTTMELGGHAPVVIFDDVDVERVAGIVAAGKFRNAGQVCVSPTRFYAQEGIYDRFAARFAEIAAGLTLGQGIDPATRMGPLANPRRVAAMQAFVEDAGKHGGRILAGGQTTGSRGNFFQPTVIRDIGDQSMLMTTEPFGPVAPVVPFRTFDEVVDRANALPFGLAAYAFTTSAKTAQAISDNLAAGMVGVNTLTIWAPETPFGGINHSGHGSEGGIEGLDAFMNLKSIAAGTL